ADQASDRRCLRVFGMNSEQFIQAIDVHTAGHNVGVFSLTHDVFFVLIPNLAYNLFHQILDGYDPGRTAIFVHHDGYFQILLLHFAQQFAAQFALRNEVHVLAHQTIDRAELRFTIRHLQNVLRENNALNVVNRSLVHRHARKWLSAQQLDELLDRCVLRYSDNLGPRLHGLANGFAPKLDHRLDQVAISRIENAFFLSRLDQRIHGFRRTFRLLVGVFLRKRCYGLTKTQYQREGKDHVNQQSENHRPARQPCTPRARKENEWEQAIEEQYDQD